MYFKFYINRIQQNIYFVTKWLKACSADRRCNPISEKRNFQQLQNKILLNATNYFLIALNFFYLILEYKYTYSS